MKSKTSTFEVEWVTHIPLDEFGDRDIDNATHKYHVLRTKDEAIDYARKVYPQDKFGAVMISEMKYDEETMCHECVAGPWYWNGEELE